MLHSSERVNKTFAMVVTVVIEFIRRHAQCYRYCTCTVGYFGVGFQQVRAEVAFKGYSRLLMALFEPSLLRYAELFAKNSDSFISLARNRAHISVSL